MARLSQRTLRNPEYLALPVPSHPDAEAALTQDAEPWIRALWMASPEKIRSGRTPGDQSPGFASAPDETASADWDSEHRADVSSEAEVLVVDAKQSVGLTNVTVMVAATISLPKNSADSPLETTCGPQCPRRAP
jgi:hypothetical protein